MKATILSCFFALVVFACGGESTSNDDPTTEASPTTANACEAAGTRLCERACACATDGKCHLGVTTDAGVASIDFGSEKECLDLYVVFGCSTGGEPGFDYAKCESAVDASSCIDTAGGRGGLMPAECNVGRQ